MNKSLSFLTASAIALSAGSVLFSTTAQAKEINCVNYWVNPTTKLAQCFDGQLNFMAVPFEYLSSASVNSEQNALVRRRATNAQEMIMPDLIGLKIDAAEDYLLGLGVTLGSEEVYAQNKVAGEIIQQNPLPGTKLTKGQTVLLQHMGATINPLQVQ